MSYLRGQQRGPKRFREKPAYRGDKNKQVNTKLGENCSDELVDHELHIWTERERRKKMKILFVNLRSLLPHLPSKVDKSTIVLEAVSYITTLQKTLENLEKQRLQLIHVSSAAATTSIEPLLASSLTVMVSPSLTVAVPPLAACFRTWISPNVVLSVAGEDAYISVCCVKKAVLLSSAVSILHKYNVEVVSAHVASDYSTSMCMLHARVTSGEFDYFTESMKIEEVYQNIAQEMISWISSCC